MLLLLAGGLAAQPSGTVFQGPITVTSGDTIRGNYQSLDSKVPAITIATTQPVVIENCIIKGAGQLIKSSIDNVDLTVRDTQGYGLPQTEFIDSPTRFVQVRKVVNLIVEHNYLQQCTGIHVDEFANIPDRIPGKTVKVRYNRAKNIDGRTARDPQTGRVFLQAQFVQLAGVRDLPGVEIAWNEIINEPNNSRVEDNISMFYSSGTSASPIRIYHNYIQGSYPIPATEQNYSGGGIMVSETGDIKDLNENTVGAFVEVYENQVVGTNHYGIAFTGGHDCKVYNNKIISSSVFEPALPTGPVPL
ncbi:glycosyl hydrolase [Hymenobacter sp. HD11105]